MLDVADVSKSYGGTAVLDGVTFRLAPGQKALLLGRNGAGKSTLLRVIASLLPRDRGAIRIAGHDPRRQPTQAARCLGYVGHASLLYQDLSVEENLRYYARLYGLPGPEASRRAGAWLEETGLAGRRRDFVRSLSQGQVRRLTIARALLHEPPLLLLDEPFAGLDADGRAWLVGLLGADRGRTVLLATHQLDFPTQAADVVLTLADGRIVEG